MPSAAWIRREALVSITYNEGTTTSVRIVANPRPNMTTTAMFRHHWVDSLLRAQENVWKS